MDKLYTLPNTQNVPSPKKETLNFIKQYAAAYVSFSTKNSEVEFVAN